MNFNEIIGHEDIISRFRSSIEQGRVSHAYIIAGQKDSGRLTLANAFAKTLQCQEGGTESCGHCKSCLQAESMNHPDIDYITHEGDHISVNDVRNQLNAEISKRPYSSKYRIFIMKEAERMTEEAQNALLKTIEEPPEYGIIILITTKPELLLPTIRSRCITFITKPVKEKDIREYLVNKLNVEDKKADFAIEYAQGNLGKAVQLATNEEYEKLIQSVIDLESNIRELTYDDISYSIQKCSDFKVNINDYLDLMMMWYRDILILKVTGNPDKILFKTEYSAIKNQAQFLSFNELELKERAITAAKERINANANLEDIMILLIMTLKEHYD
ncbi:MAG: DNA polymerase III subunit delta' [Eubacterium sp.]|nr:DNA polymerase III subunit delta' [Eubacterium sp.]